jgi:hypothetical protein
VLTIEVSPEAAQIPGLEIKRDGVALGRGAWGAPVPIDGGEHVIEATAPGKLAFSLAISVKQERDQARISVPVLADASAPAPTPAEPAPAAPAATAPPPPAAPPPAVPTRDETPARPWGGLEWAGVGTAAAGVIALGASGYFLMDALDNKDKADPDCNDENQCGKDGLAKLDDAVASGNVATALSIGGGVLVAAGAALFIVGRVGASEKQSAALGLRVGRGGAALELRGRF